MAKLDFSKIPKYSQLPIKPGAPAHSNWGVFGDDDEIGCFNFLTPEGIIEAAKLIREGKTFQISAVMQTSRRHGMTTLNDALLELVEAGTVAPEEAYLHSFDKNGLATAFRGRGIDVSYVEAEPTGRQSGSQRSP